MEARKPKSEFHNPAAVNVLLSEFDKEFNVVEYLNFYEATSIQEIRKFMRHKLQCFHESFSTIQDGVRVLDYGAGPHISSVISAAGKASEIVLAEFLDQNRAQLNFWLQSDENSFDWSTYFTYVVEELEGRDKAVVKEREYKVRQLVKAVVHCDITQDPPIELGYDGYYDVVISSLVLESASNSPEDYNSNFSRLCKLVAPGGSLFLYGVENETRYYSIGCKNYPNAYITNNFALKVVKDSGLFSNVTLSTLDCGDRVFRFIRGTR